MGEKSEKFYNYGYMLQKEYKWKNWVVILEKKKS